MADGFSVEVVVPTALKDLTGSGAALLNALRFNSPDIAAQIEDRIRERTQRMTGALAESITGVPYTSAVSGARSVMLAKWFANEDDQLSEWGRVYVQYQEGKPLGEHTYTNPPRQMFEQVEIEDLGLIQTWAEAAVQNSVDGLLGGSGTETTAYGG